MSTCDQLDDGVSAVYTFFDPSESKRSLGVFAILKQIEYVKSLSLDYVYLGYWVPHANKMNYKSQYAPFELLLDGQWRRINRHLDAKEIQELGDMLMTTLLLSGTSQLLNNRLELLFKLFLLNHFI